MWSTPLLHVVVVSYYYWWFYYYFENNIEDEIYQMIWSWQNFLSHRLLKKNVTDFSNSLLQLYNLLAFRGYEKADKINYIICVRVKLCGHDVALRSSLSVLESLYFLQWETKKTTTF